MIGAALLTSLLAFAPQETALPPIADFFLEAADNRRVGLVEETPGRVATLVAVLSSGCGESLRLIDALAAKQDDFARRHVRLLAVDPDPRDDAAALVRFASDHQATFPLLRDPRQLAMKKLGATRTGSFVLLDAEFRVATLPALKDLLEPLPTSNGGLGLAALAAFAPADVTFHRDVAPILWKNCVECHRPGQIGPMSFLDAKEAIGWAPTIAEVTASGRMPPWHADPHFGHWKGARRLTDTEIDTLARFAASGAKAGDPHDAPPTPTFADPEWRIGKPDLVIELPKEEQIPAEGVVPYRYVPVDPHFTADRWVAAAELRPGNLAVTHHAGVYLLPPGMDAKHFSSQLLFAGAAPGGRPIELAPGTAKFIPKGSRLLFEMHYTPNGKPATDRTRLGLRFASGVVDREVRTRTLAQMELLLPPNDPAITFTHQEGFRSPGRLVSLQPHMHLRGRSFRIDLAHADGSSATLLYVPRWDFGFQHTYEFEQPIAVVPGDSLTLTATYDNSSGNPANPDPAQRVLWGSQSFEEMMVGFIGIERDLPTPIEPAAAPAK